MTTLQAARNLFRVFTSTGGFDSLLKQVFINNKSLKRSAPRFSRIEMAAGGAFKSASKFLKYFENGKGFYSVLNKVKVISAGEGRCTCELELTEEHLNAGDTLHGGLTATLVDTISTVAITTTNNPPGISTDLNVTYMRPAKKGDTISIVAECLKVGKTMAFINVDIFNKNDGNRIVAQGRHTKLL